jgi:pyruvate formate lyase activating enzyme
LPPVDIKQFYIKMENAVQKRLVLSLTRMTVHNGPGIRTLIQFKGCPLHCLWCSTPESQKPGPEIVLYRNKCNNCLQCVSACSLNAIGLTDGAINIDRYVCDNCGKCVEVCNTKALEILGQSMTVSEIIEEARKDRVIYKHSRGGVTLSGGEPLLDPVFSQQLLKSFRAESLSVGVDTCGYVPWENIEPVLPYIDFFLWDIKIMSPVKHKRLTGVSNSLILDNATRVSDRNIPIYVRIPVIPGYTDSDENIKAIGHFARGLSSVVEIDILPLHHLGKARYHGLGLAYPLADIPLVPDSRMRSLQEMVRACGLKCNIIS